MSLTLCGLRIKNIIMKRLLTFVAICLFAVTAYSQQDPQFSMNMYTHAAMNPGAAGIGDGVCATALIREQWLGFEGRPSSKVFNVNSPLTFLDLPIGAGLTIVTDNIGFNKNASVSLAVSYQAEVANGLLGVGIDLGFQNHSLSNTDWTVGSGTSVGSDPLIPNDESASALDLAFGVYYKQQNFYLGFASRHLTEPGIEYNQQSTIPIKRHYHITGGYDIQLPNPYFILKPSIYSKYDGSSMQVDANVIVEYDQRMWGGITYRLEDAYVAMFGMDVDLNSGGVLSFGGAWDFPTTEIGTYASGSIEFFVRYCFQLKMKGGRTKQGTIWD